MRWRRVLLFAAGTYLLLSVFAGAFLAEVALRPGRRPLTHERDAAAIARSLGASLQDVELKGADGVPLQAWFAQPARPNGNAVLLLHGVSDNREGVGGYAQLFLGEGYSVLLPDSRAHGASGGTLATYGLREGADVQQWVSWLIATQHAKCVFGFGESMGAAILLESLGEEQRFCAVVAESPFADFRNAAYDRIGDKLRIGPFLAMAIFAPTVEAGFRYANLRYGVDFAQVEPKEAVAHSQVPVFLIHGTSDVNLRPRGSRLIRAGNPQRVTLWEVPGAGHCGASAAAPEEFRRRVLGWFAQAQQARPPH